IFFLHLLGLSSINLAKILFEISPQIMLIPAHIWTPWFSLFGSNSGFDTIEECFGPMSKFIYAGETGLSSDPEMNWRLSQLDKITLISNSDAHSLPNLGREANIFNVEDGNYDYDYICEIIKAKDPRYFPATIEFYPEEGKYHFDGHRNCQATRLHPKEAIKNKNICPVCHKPLTIGVLHRVEDLADRAEGYKPKNFPASIHLVPLQEIIAETKGVVKTSKKVQEEYLNIINNLGNEFSILMDKPEAELKENLEAKVVEGIINVRNNKVAPIAGYDGVYGVVKVFNQNQAKKEKNAQDQSALF
ncbi:MAG: endonuclease Q family protein, partial [Patescibacteria group bacterium]|nr:endonuclease Q family protein [Patescibacteria group bacterium]